MILKESCLFVLGYFMVMTFLQFCVRGVSFECGKLGEFLKDLLE